MGEKRTGHLWALIEEWMDSQTFRPSQSQLAEKIDVSRSTLSEWKYGTSMPKPGALERLAEFTRMPHTRLLDAALKDAGYDPQENKRRRGA